MAEVHLKIIKARFGSVPLSAVKPSDVRAWTATLKAEGRADSYVDALHSRLSQLFTDAVHDGLVARDPAPGVRRRDGQAAALRSDQRAGVGVDEAVPPGVRPAILLGAHAGCGWPRLLRSVRPTSTSLRAWWRRRCSGSTSR